MSFSEHEIEIMQIGASQGWPVGAIAAVLSIKAPVVAEAMRDAGLEIMERPKTPRCMVQLERFDRLCMQPTHHHSGRCRFHRHLA